MGVLILETGRHWNKEFNCPGATVELIYPPKIGDVNTFNDQRMVELTNLYIEPKHRGKGKASKIIDLVKKYAVRQKLKLFIRVCPYGDGDKLNKKQLRKFYTDRGFVKYKKDPDWYLWSKNV
jgi:GNAT superfamily N-acetyltransferase